MVTALRFQLVGDTGQDVRFIADTGALPALAISLGVALVVTLVLHRAGRLDHPVLTMSAMSGIALVIAVTLFRDGWPQGFDVGRAASWSMAGIDRMAEDPFGSSQFTLNVILFVPAGLALTLLTRLPLRVLATLVVGAIGVETLQSVLGVGVADVADLVANSLGAAIGCAAGAVTLRRSELRWDTRATRGTAMALGVAAALVVAGAWAGADQRQSSVESELEAAFSGTTLADIQTWIDDQALDSRVFGAVSVRADGIAYEPASVRVRYPSFFMGIRRCVFAIWTSNDLVLERGSGDRCTEFMG